jgi:ubiquinone/menaquinone biosynthesis C-methylase UbiE
MTASTYFDTRFQTMQQVTATEGIEALCYTQQRKILESLITPGMTVLDVGCGPALPYRAKYAFVIGLDPSAASLAKNTDVDQRMIGTATSLVIDDNAIDLVVAFYSLHHMTGRDADETFQMRQRALGEMRRVLRPGGELLVFEVTPWTLAAIGQSLFWGLAKRLLGRRLDAYFWPDEEYIGADIQTFTCSPFATFSPALSLPWLKIPRFLYPFNPTLYRWKKG